MRLSHSAAFTLSLALASCGPTQPSKQHQDEPATTFGNHPLAADPSTPVEHSPAPTVDPKSSEAAVEVVRGFVRLLNQGKFDEAYMLLGPGAPPRTAFHERWETLDRLSVDVGTPGEQEGAAGSIYLSVPLDVSAVEHGRTVRHSATAVLRRVNDVPGSTESQRHWHIERVDWKDAS